MTTSKAATAAGAVPAARTAPDVRPGSRAARLAVPARRHAR